MTQLIVEHSGDPRPHARQAASWALRSIGKRDAANHERALAAAAELLETGDATKRWVGRDAMRELESLIKVPQRGRLLTSKSKTGPQAIARRFAVTVEVYFDFATAVSSVFVRVSPCMRPMSS